MSLRTALNLVGALVNLTLVGWMLWGVYHGHHYEARLALLPDLELVLRADPLALLFVTLSAGLWLLTTVYAIGYLEGSPHRSRFFGFFSLCVTATDGVALAGNLITFLSVLRTADPGHLSAGRASRHGSGPPCRADLSGLHHVRWRVAVAGHGVALYLDGQPGVYTKGVSSWRGGRASSGLDGHLRPTDRWTGREGGAGAAARLAAARPWSHRRRSAHCCMRWPW